MKKEVFKKLERWWAGEEKKPVIQLCVIKDKNFMSFDEYWPSESAVGDLDSFVNAQLESTKKLEYFGVSYPSLPHQWGKRGTPMTMSAYLGCDVYFGQETVWYKKFVDDWSKTTIAFDENNKWVQASKKLMEKQIEKTDGNCIVVMPDLGDALTCFSMMRGVEQLLIDVVESPEIIIEKIDCFVDAWIQAHKFFHRIYSSKLSGDSSWLLWAPGKTYACQCDFSTMISPKMFEKFVVYELEKIKDYLEFVAWHLDGPDEIKHLDILLALPYVKTIQVTPGAGRPTCASELWIPNIRKILNKGKNVIIYASNVEQFNTLIEHFPSGRVLIGCYGIDPEKEDDRKFLKQVEPYF
ncbi:MAG: hypothetical protein NC831_08010 [Candidatus Omnitrophica bacterium]|nr:hypothetical protein [Candidatus Omnitrophota bacterium]MCM8828822.1 hypothetical protein [Candidatus Omnitrophota bacterium]